MKPIPAIWIHPARENEGFCVTFVIVTEINDGTARVKFTMGKHSIYRDVKTAELHSTAEKSCAKIRRLVDEFFDSAPVV